MKTVVFVLLAVTSISIAFPTEKEDQHGKKITKRSLYTDNAITLTGMEKISKRSAGDEDVGLGEDEILLRNVRHAKTFLPAFARRPKREAADIEEDMDTAASGVYFLPSFARRGFRGKRSAPANDDMETAASGVYFLPSFARRGFRGKRSAPEAPANDDMETAASGVYFLPSFARRGFRSNK